MRMYVVEGTPDEISQVVNKMETGSVAIQALNQTAFSAGSATGAQASEGDRVYVETDVARRVFRRRPLSQQQRQTLEHLVKAHPEWVTAQALQKATGYSPAQFAGLMGAFGRRLTHTDGYVEGSWLFDCEWSDETRGWLYKLPETVFDAVKAEKIA